MNFKDINDTITISEIYAIGPAISILMEGYIEKNKLVSLRELWSLQQQLIKLLDRSLY